MAEATVDSPVRLVAPQATRTGASGAAQTTTRPGTCATAAPRGGEPVVLAPAAPAPDEADDPLQTGGSVVETCTVDELVPLLDRMLRGRGWDLSQPVFQIMQRPDTPPFLLTDQARQVIRGRCELTESCYARLLHACGLATIDGDQAIAQDEAWWQAWQQLNWCVATSTATSTATGTGTAAVPQQRVAGHDLVPAPRRGAPTHEYPDYPDSPRSASIAPAPTPAGRRRRRRVLSGLLLGCAVLLSLATSTLVALRPWTDRDTVAGHDTPPQPRLSTDPVTSTVPARSKLLDIAAAIRTDPAGVAGRYTYTRILTTSYPTTGGSGPIIDDEQLWWAADRSGLQRLIRLSANGTTLSAKTTRYVAGELPVPIPVPATEPSMLRAQLAERQPAFLAGAGLLRAVADLNRFHALTSAQRVAVLQVLTTLDDLTYRGGWADDERTGVAFSADTNDNPAHPTRETVVFDPDTGQLIAYDSSTVPGTRPAQTLTSTSYLARGRTEQSG